MLFRFLVLLWEWNDEGMQGTRPQVRKQVAWNDQGMQGTPPQVRKQDAYPHVRPTLSHSEESITSRTLEYILFGR